MKSIFALFILSIAVAGCATTQTQTPECVSASTENCQRTPSNQQDRSTRFDRHR